MTKVMVDRKGFLSAITDLAKFRDSDRDKGSVVRISADPQTGLEIAMINVTDGIHYRHILPIVADHFATFIPDPNAAYYIDLDHLLKLPFHDEQIYFTFQEKRLDMQSGLRVVTMKPLDQYDWTFPDNHTMPIVDVINGRRFASALKYVLASIETGESHRPALRSVRYEFKANGLTSEWWLVGCDGFAMHTATINRPGEEKTMPFHLQLDGEIMRRLIPQLENAGFVFIHRETKDKYNLIRLQIGNTEIMFAETQGVFPAYAHLLNETAPLYCSYQRAPLLQMVKDVAGWEGDLAYLNNDGITTSSWKGLLEIKFPLPFRAYNDHMTTKHDPFCFNPRLLKRSVEVLPKRSADVLIKMTDGNHALSIETTFDEIHYIGVVMPMAKR